MNRLGRTAWFRGWTDDWHDKSLFLLLGIFLYQYVIWFDFYWLEETRPIVERALAATFACRLVAPKFPWGRGALSVAACVYLTALAVRPEPVEGWFDHALSPLLGAAEYMLRLSPFVWFAIGAWALYSTVHWYIRTKWRMFSFMAGSIVLFCIVDSFSLFQLWEQVAIMIGCGLLMLVIHHLKQLKTKDPEGYVNLMSYPLPITVTIVTIISASLLLGILAPGIRPIVMDPYTAWKTYQGEAVPAFSSGPGFAALSSAGATSGYSRNDESLGGAFNFDYSPVFTVDTTRRSYWRGETRTEYNGEGWETTNFADRDSLVPVAVEPEYPIPPEEGGLETLEITQTFRIVEGKSFPVLFAAPFARSVAPAEVNGEPVSLGRALWDTNNQSILWSERSRVPYPSAYTVTSHMPIIDEEKLRASAKIENLNPFRDYLQLPEQLPQRVKDLALEVTAEAPSPYEKAKALEAYLSTTFPYTNTPDLTKRRSGDFVDGFLFEVQEGYCDYFSTAMVVMARSLDMPARWVKGYISGQSSDEMIFEQYLPGEQIDLNGPGLYTVRNSDAHSWVEIYFEGYGWIPFEPTAGFTLPIVQVENETEVQLPDNLSAPVSTAPAETAGAGGEGSATAATIAAGAVVAAAVAFIGYRFQWLTLFRTRNLRKSPNYNVKFLADMERLLLRFRRKGLTWSEHETIREMAMRWMKQHAWLQKDLEVLLATFEKAKYSGTRLTEEEYNNAEHRIRKLRENL